MPVYIRPVAERYPLFLKRSVHYMSRYRCRLVSSDFGRENKENKRHGLTGLATGLESKCVNYAGKASILFLLSCRFHHFLTERILWMEFRSVKIFFGHTLGFRLMSEICIRPETKARCNRDLRKPHLQTLIK